MFLISSATLILEIANVTNFLRQYESKETKRSYRAGLKQFFELIYPELKGEDLDTIAERHLSEDRGHRDDVLNFRESLKDKSPKTRTSRLNVVRVFLDENGITFPKLFFKTSIAKSLSR